MKALVEMVAWYVLQAGMSIGTLAAVVVGIRGIWREGGGWRTWAAAAGLLCVLVAYVVAWASFIYQWRYGFDFNDATIRMRFVRPISEFATAAFVLALFAKGSRRTAILVGSVLVQMYCVFQVDAI